MCGCGLRATIKEAPDFPTPWYRKCRGLPEPGHYITSGKGEVVDNARIRWVCSKPKGSGNCGFSTFTYPRENPRLYTYLPHAGNHDRAALRVALLDYRNTIESSFSMLKDMALAGKSQDRPAWAGDEQMDHLVWMTVATMTGRLLVHHNGLYSAVWDEADALDLLKASMPTTNQTPALTQEEWADLEEALKQYATAPEGWPEIGDTPNTDVHQLRAA